jgi:hypothetical protein
VVVYHLLHAIPFVVLRSNLYLYHMHPNIGWSTDMHVLYIVIGGYCDTFLTTSLNIPVESTHLDFAVHDGLLFCLFL